MKIRICKVYSYHHASPVDGDPQPRGRLPREGQWDEEIVQGIQVDDWAPLAVVLGDQE